MAVTLANSSAEAAVYTRDAPADILSEKVQNVLYLISREYSASYCSQLK